jgi:TonB family protein
MRSLPLGLAVVAVLCSTAIAKPAWRPPRTDAGELADRLEDAIRHHDTAAVQALLADSVSFNGLWFPDAACAKRFAGQSVVDGKTTRELARCFAQLAPIATTRKSSLTSGAILTFAPGFELELMFRNEKLVYAASLWPRDEDRGAPTLTTQAFEALRKTGTTQLDAALAKHFESKRASAWIKVCLDKQGAITAKYLASGQPTTVAGEAFVHAIADWTFKPFTHRKAPIAVCSLTLLTYPAANAPAAETLPAPTVTVATDRGSPIYDELESPYDFTGIQLSGQPPPTISAKMLETHRLRGSKQILPDATMQAEFEKARHSLVGTSVKLCVDTNGTVFSVSLLKSSGFTSYDRKITREVKRWTFKPFSTAVCSVASFVWRKP